MGRAEHHAAWAGLVAWSMVNMEREQCQEPSGLMLRPVVVSYRANQSMFGYGMFWVRMFRVGRYRQRR